MSQCDVQGLINATQFLMTGEELMFAMEVPYAPVQEAAVMLTQAKSKGKAAAPDFVLSACKETEHAGWLSVSIWWS